jgi:hypothetical protein
MAAVLSCERSRSGERTTISPGATGRPAFRENIFSAKVCAIALATI